MNGIVVCFSLALCAVAVQGFEWGYAGQHRPSKWGGVCKEGSKQSPVNLCDAVDSDVGTFNLDALNQPSDVSIKNNGHSVVLTPQQGLYSVSGAGLPTSYMVLQAHFHWGSTSGKGSEHTVKGKAFPMEMHIVTHKKDVDASDAMTQAEGLAVLGFFFKIAEADNPQLESLIAQVDKVSGPGRMSTLDGQLAIADLFEGVDTSKFYRYSGSLTTPGCFESVIWTLFEEPIAISEKQMRAFRRLKADTRTGAPLFNNFRPVQPINGRVILKNN